MRLKATHADGGNTWGEIAPVEILGHHRVYLIEHGNTASATDRNGRGYTIGLYRHATNAKRAWRRIWGTGWRWAEVRDAV